MQRNLFVRKNLNNIFIYFSKHYILAAFFFLLAIKVCVFGPIVGHVGVYLDEWSTFYKLHFCHQTFLDLLNGLLFDPRYVIRPACVPYVALLYYFCNEKPLVYHLLNQACEFAGAFFLYLALLIALRNKALSFLAALLFLIYPTHDITHYSIGAVSTSIAVTLYIVSLWLFLLALDCQRAVIAKRSTEETGNEKFFLGGSDGRKTYGLILLSAVFFFISLFSYEICLPLFLVFTASVAIILRQEYKPVKVVALAAFYTVPALMAVGLTIFYRKVLLAWMGLGCGYRTVFDLANFMHVLYGGIKVSILPYAFSFFLKLAGNYLDSGLDSVHLILLIVAAAALVVAMVGLAKDDSTAFDHAPGLRAIVLGLFILICAYLVFGLSPDYLPVLDTHINRVNTASSIGAAMIVAGVLWCLSGLINSSSKQMQALILACMTLPILWLFILADWQFAYPWMVSWEAQKQIMAILKKRVGICSGDTIILANVPRYVMWASVFDGVWDFESALRINLNRTDINGGVLSDRMVVMRNNVEDRFQDSLCAKYPLKQMFFLVPNPERWIPIHSSQEFIQFARQYGVTVSIDKIYKMPLMKPFSFKCLTVKHHLHALKKKLGQH